MLALLATVLILYLGACYMLARSYLSPIRFRSGSPMGLVEAKAGETPVWTTPGLGRSKVLFVMAHGYGGSKSNWQDLMHQLHASGYDCVAPAMPGQDDHPEATVGFGHREAQTIVDAVRWARGKYQQPPKVVLVGLSMGGAASWLATELDTSIDGVVTEGAYARFDEAMRDFLNRGMPFGSVVLRPVVWFASAMSGLRPNEVVPLASAEKWKGRPALVIQAADDRLIVKTHAERLAEASGAELWMVPGAAHAQCMTTAGDDYADRLARFAESLP